MPKAVRAFVWLSIASILLAIPAVLVATSQLADFERAQLQTMGWTAVLLPVAIFGVGLPASLVWLTASRRQGWARVVMAVLFVIGLVAFLSDAEAIRTRGWTYSAFFLVQALLQGVALVYVFSEGAKPWFEKRAT